MPDDAVVEIPCTVDRGRAARRRLAPVEGHQLGLMQQVKAVERAVIEAVAHRVGRCRAARVRAAPPGRLGSTARRLLAGYRAASPEVDALLS